MSRFFKSALLTLMVAMTACASTGEVPDNLSAETLFETGLTALHEEDWTDAIAYFERFTIQYPAHPRAQEARFNVSQAYFGKEEYITAANEFSRLANDYPAGPWADDARFKVCESYYELSPKPELDQQYTRAALDHCQSLITYYPESEMVPKAQELLDSLRNKLAEKAFLTGEFYYSRNAFDSAIIYYDAAVRDYPQTPTAARALHRLYETYVKLGYDEEAEAAKARLLKDYPTSPEARQLQEPPPTPAS